MIDVVIATFEELPDLYEDERILVDALRSRDLGVAAWSWDDPNVDWKDARLCLLRSVWDYHLRRDEFLAWMDSLPQTLQIWNPPDLVRWNSHKGYLRDLERLNIPIVETEWLTRGDRPDLGDLMGAKGWDAVVIKPTVSADAYRTSVFDDANLQTGQKHLDELLEDGEAMVQRFMEEVHDTGERCLIDIAGEITHAVRKTTVFDPAWEDKPPRVEPSDDEIALARRAIAASGYDYLYARVDMIHDEGGEPRLMELEMFEPSLYFAEEPASAGLLADRVVELLG